MNTIQLKSMKTYSPEEEKLNIASHALGMFLSLIALILLLVKGASSGDILHLISAGIFGISLLILYSASTFFHSAREVKLRKKLNILDHAAIFLLIAGSYTPFTLITLKGKVGWIIFSVVWGIALIGMILKLFYTGRYKRLSTLMYVLMGWVIVFASNSLIENLPSIGLYWLIAGGLFYTIGAIFYSIKKIKFNHAIFHLFVLLGSFCHFWCIYFYVIYS